MWQPFSRDLTNPRIVPLSHPVFFSTRSSVFSLSGWINDQRSTKPNRSRSTPRTARRRRTSCSGSASPSARTSPPRKSGVAGAVPRRLVSTKYVNCPGLLLVFVVLVLFFAVRSSPKVEYNLEGSQISPRVVRSDGAMKTSRPP